MIHQIRFPYGTSEILLRSRREIPDKFADSLSSFISFADNDLNPSVKGSSAHRFNTTDTGLPIDASSEFIKFLDLLVELQKVNPNEHFFSDDGAVFFTQIDRTNNKIVKDTDLTFNSRGIKTPFILDAVKHFLSYENNFDDFLIIYSNLYSASGENEWRIQVPELGSHNVDADIGVLNSSVVVNEYDMTKPKTTVTKFGHTPLFTDPEYVLVNADSLTKAHILSNAAHAFVHDLDFHNFATESNSKVMVKTKSGDIHSFPF